MTQDDFPLARLALINTKDMIMNTIYKESRNHFGDYSRTREQHAEIGGVDRRSYHAQAEKTSRQQQRDSRGSSGRQDKSRNDWK
jgi:hypothetical protein